ASGRGSSRAGAVLDRPSTLLDIRSTMKDHDSRPALDNDHINARISRRGRALRSDLGVALDALAARSSVSRSMLSLVERGESSPTAVVLEKIATGLNVPL